MDIMTSSFAGNIRSWLPFLVTITDEEGNEI